MGGLERRQPRIEAQSLGSFWILLEYYQSTRYGLNSEIRGSGRIRLQGAKVDDIDRIGRYQLCFELAVGGLATVYLARASGASEPDEALVAIKRMHPALLNEPGYAKMFADEGWIGSLVSHPNLSRVIDYGEENGELYIAMEYLVGEPLSRVFHRILAVPDDQDRARLTYLAAQLVADACRGLHAAHEIRGERGEFLNIVHSDVSPNNLFVGYDGRVRIIDFGVASAQLHSDHSSPGQVIGTFPFMAPEQMAVARVDRRVDIWSLGVLLWELVTLRPLFEKDSDVNTMYAVLSGEISAPSKYNEHVPAELDEIVLRALERNPEARWQTAEQLGDALDKFLSGCDKAPGAQGVADWMAELFPQGQSQKRQLMELALLAKSTPPKPMGRLQKGAAPVVAGLVAIALGVLAALSVMALGWGPF